MLLKEFDYILPESFIAQYPIDTRHNSKLAVLRRSKQEVLHRQFFDIGEFLACGDVLVVNDTKVIPARLHGKKLTGGCIEVLLLEKIEADLWRCLAKPSRKLKPGMKIFFDDSLHGEITSRNGRGLYVKFSGSKDVFESIKRVGKTPLPLYIKREEEGFDSLRYQTIFAQKEGAIAAPTAGLHFTHDVLNTLKEKGVVVVSITLRTGYGTFAPIKTETVESHKMEKESFAIGKDTVRTINDAKKAGKKVVAVGTTVVRALESSVGECREVGERYDETDLFIFPGFRFKIVDALITNFHLPRSTPLLLTCAFAGKELLLRVYDDAIKMGYRFLSYGDSMLIL